MNEIQQTATVVTPYVWECAAFFGAIGVSRTTQWMKQKRFWPGCLCVQKSSRRGVYLQLRRAYLMGFNYAASFVVIAWCLHQRYTDLNQVLVITLIVVANQFAVIEYVLSRIKRNNPEFAEIISHGLYIQDSDQTIITKAAQLMVGGGKEQRDG